MKKWAVLFSILVAVALVVAACGAATPTPQAPAEPMEGSESGEMVKADMMDDAFSETMDDASSETMDEDSADMMDEDSDDDMMDETSDEDMMDKDSDADMMDETSDADMMDEDSDADMMDETSEAMMDLPAWFSAELIDVSSGEPFSIADAQGKVILVETMAIWCSNCLRQQQEVKALHEALGDRDDLVTVVLDIDLNEDADKLQAYAAQHGFDWAYAVSPPEVAREISQLYGAQFLNPPSTPMLIIDRHGEAHPLPFGRKTAADLEEALTPFLDEDM